MWKLRWTHFNLMFEWPIVFNTLYLTRQTVPSFYGHISTWISSFLSIRTGSRWCEITNRTRYIWRSSRHSARSPVVSNIYINEISAQLESPVRLFADNSVVYREIRSIEDTHTLQQDLFRLQEWADKWQVSFNVAKCKVLRITRKTKHKIAAKYLMSTPNKPRSDIKVPRSTYK